MKTSGDIKTFRDLIVWQKGMALTKRVYGITDPMPDRERFGLTNQMRRAAVSIPSNIAEGYARQTSPEYLRFLRMARGSLAELETQLLLAEDLSMIQLENDLMELLRETDRVLQGLLRKIEARIQMTT